MDKNEQLARELEACKAQLSDAVAMLEGSQKALAGNICLDVELKDVCAQMADSMKENKKLRRGIYGKNASKLFDSLARKFIKKIFPCRNVNGSP